MLDPGSPLDYPEHDRVITTDGILGADAFKKLDEESLHLHKNGLHFRTSAGWADEAVRSSTPVVQHNLVNKELINEIRKSVREHVGDYNIDSLHTVGSQYQPGGLYHQYWPAGSYITWHRDRRVKAAMTIYLSEHDNDDGGYFMFDDGKGVKAVKPKPNRSVCVIGGIPHCVTTVNQGSPVRRTIQVWLS